MELTPEYLDQHLKQPVNKADLEEVINKQTRELTSVVERQTEELARIIAETVANPLQEHFEQIHKEMQLEREVQELKRDMLRIKQALHLS
jgi:hypothetical protein